jgi:uncharacterized protein YdaU (DUF1376 family)
MRKRSLPTEVLEFFRKQGAKGGKIGGKRSLETMTPEERSARAKKASQRAAEVRTKKAAAKKKATAKKAATLQK